MSHSVRDSKRSRSSRRRAVAYGIAGATLLIAYPLLRGSRGISGPAAHTVMETAATLLALFVGVVGLIGYHSRPRGDMLFLGVGFLGTGVLDGYHCVVTSPWFEADFPSAPPSLLPWSWSASRSYLAMMLVLSLLAWRRERRLGDAARVPASWVYSISAALMVATFFFFAFVPLPRAYFPDLSFSRPKELIAGGLFVIALVGQLRKGAWRNDATEHWLVVALIVSIAAQVVYMASSERLFDGMFDVAHLMKKVSYVCVLIGLLTSLFDVYREAGRTAQELEALVEVRTTELEDALRLIKEAEERMAVALEAAGAGTWSLDARTREETWDESLMHLFGRELAAGATAQRCRFRDVVRADDIEALEAAVDDALSDGDSLEAEFRAVLPQGDLLHAAIRGRVHRDPEGRAIRMSGVCWDVSEARRARLALERANEELRQSNRDLEQFAAVASHDLQEPLRTIGSFTQLLAARYPRGEGDDIDEFVGFILDGVTRMRRLIDDLLQFSRVGTAGMPFEEVALEDVVAVARHDLGIAEDQDDVEFRIGELPTVLGDRGQLAQLMRNLISNSMKFRREETLVIDIRAARNEGALEITVTDNGIGIAAEHRQRVFQIFRRLHSRETYSGTGVGLAICKRIAERHGGTIGIRDRTEGPGTTVVITLPHGDSSSWQTA